MTKTFQPGDRVTISELGRATFPQSKMKTGTVKSAAVFGECHRVLWDGRKNTMILHANFITKI